MQRVLTVQKIPQQPAHCGPATLAMLFSYHKTNVAQKAISAAAGMADIIWDAQGMRIDELHAGIQALYPDGEYQLLAKYQANIDDIVQVLGEFNMPLGVEWQGYFELEDGSHENMGHYTVINGVDQARGLLYVVDPERQNLLTLTGKIEFETFKPRWWEVDIVPMPHDDSVTAVIEMERLIFVIAPAAKVDHLAAVGFRPATLGLMWEYATPLEEIELNIVPK